MEHTYLYGGFTLTMRSNEQGRIITDVRKGREWLNSFHEDEGGSLAAEEWCREYVAGLH